MTLYNDYRPKRFKSLIGQPSAIGMRNAVRLGKFPSANLLTGPRGTGKTSLARVVSLALNCENPKDGEPCLRCDCCRHPNFIELDTMYYKQDMVETLKSLIYSSPASGKYRVIIFDEFQAATKKIQDNFLKTFEEMPKQSVVFLLTTETVKVSKALSSRCVWWPIFPVPVALIEERLKLVAKREKMKISIQGLNLIARNCEGSVRDGLSHLEIFIGHGGRISEKVIRERLAIIKTDKAISCILEERVFDLMVEVEKLYQMYGAKAILQTLARDIMECVKGNPDDSRNGLYAGVAYSLREQSLFADQTLSPLAALQCAVYHAFESQHQLPAVVQSLKPGENTQDFDWQGFCKYLITSAELDMVSQEVVAESMFLSSVELEGITIRYDHALGRDVLVGLIEAYREYESNPYVWERRQTKHENKRRGTAKGGHSSKKHRRRKVTK